MNKRKLLFVLLMTIFSLFTFGLSSFAFANENFEPFNFNQAVGTFMDFNTHANNASLANDTTLTLAIPMTVQPMAVAGGSTVVIPAWRSGNTAVIINRAANSLMSQFAINVNNSANVQVVVFGELILSDGAAVSATRRNIWNVEFVVQEGGSLTIGRNSVITRDITVEHGGLFQTDENGSYSGNLIELPPTSQPDPQPDLKFSPQAVEIPNALEGYNADAYAVDVTVSNIGDGNSDKLSYVINGDFEIHNFPNSGVMANSSEIFTILPKDDLLEGVHTGEIIIMHNSEFFTIDITFEVEKTIEEIIEHSLTVNFLIDGAIVHTQFSIRTYGEQVNIASPSFENDTIFSHWSGDLAFNTENITFTMPNHDVVLNQHRNTALIIPQSNRLFVEKYLYDEFVLNLEPIVFLGNVQQEILHDQDGRPFVTLPQNTAFQLHINQIAFYDFIGLQGDVDDMFFMGDEDITLRADFVELYRFLVDGYMYEGRASAIVPIVVQNRPNHIFGGWVIDNGNIVIANPQAQSTSVIVPKGTYAGQIIAEIRSVWHTSTQSIAINGGGVGNYFSGTPIVGETITIFAGVRNGYNFAGWLLNGIFLSANTITTFTMPNGNVVLTAQWTPINQETVQIPPAITTQNQTPRWIVPEMPQLSSRQGTVTTLQPPLLTDFITQPIYTGLWHDDYLNFALTNGIIDFPTIDAFSPNSTLTHEVFAYFAANLGITSTFDPFTFATRYDVAYTIHIHLQTLGFDISDNPMYTMYEYDIYINTEIDPQNTMTRAEALAVLVRLSKLLANNPS